VIYEGLRYYILSYGRERETERSCGKGQGRPRVKILGSNYNGNDLQSKIVARDEQNERVQDSENESLTFLTTWIM
jgi:hypothetical protein